MSVGRDLLPYIDRLHTARVLCIGDVLLDHFIYGTLDPVAREASVPILSITEETRSLGGAGNVLRSVRTLGASSSFVSVIGNDEAAREIERLLAAQDGAEIQVLVQPHRTTTVKTRYVAGNRQLLRAYRQTATPLAPHIRNDLLMLARELVRNHSVVVISDQAMGVLTEGVALEIIRAAKESGARVVVDPKGGDHIRYRGADLLTPNRRELGQATGMRVTCESEIVAASRSLIERCGLGAVLVSLDGNAMLLAEADGAVRVVGAASHDLSGFFGAEDVVVATVAVALGTGAPLGDAVRLAGVAAGIVASSEGTIAADAAALSAALTPDVAKPGEKESPLLTVN